jgi:hypothetical protein
VSRLIGPAWVAVVGASVAAVAITGRIATRSRSAAATAQSELALVAKEAQELVTLRAAAAAPAARHASAGLAQRVGAALTRAGLSASCLSSLSPEAQSMVAMTDGQPRLKRQRATLVLTSLTLPQLGSFLDAWRSSEPEWTVTGLDVSPAAGGSAVQSTGGDLPLRVVLALESVSTEEPTPASLSPVSSLLRTTSQGHP